MIPDLIENFTKRGTRFCVIFLSLFMGLYWLFQSSFMLDINQKAFKNSFDFFLTTSLPKVKIWTESENKKDPFLFTINFYSKKGFELKKQEAIEQGKKSVDVSTKQTKFNGRHMTNLYLPFLLALFLATPLYWKNKIPALFFGVLVYWVTLMYIFVVKIVLAIGQRNIGEYNFEGFTKSALQNIAKIANVGFFSVLIIFIWLVAIVLFSRGAYFSSKKIRTIT